MTKPTPPERSRRELEAKIEELEEKLADRAAPSPSASRVVQTMAKVLKRALPLIDHEQSCGTRMSGYCTCVRRPLQTMSTLGFEAMERTLPEGTAPAPPAPTDGEEPGALKEVREWAAQGCGRDHDILTAWEADRRALAEAEERAEKAEAELAFARDLLERVVIQGGAQSWDESQMRDWCCDYRDFSNGYAVEFIRRHSDHVNCGHREHAPPGTPLVMSKAGLLGERARSAEAERDQLREALSKPIDAGKAVSADLLEMKAECDYLSDTISAAEDALPEGFRVDAEHGLAECIVRALNQRTQ